MTINKYYVIECWSDFQNELMFVGNDGHWTPFLTDAKSFMSKEEAKKYYEDSKLPHIGEEITCRFY